MDVHLDLDEEEVDYLNDNGITDVIQENLTQVKVKQINGVNQTFKMNSVLRTITFRGCYWHV